MSGKHEMSRRLGLWSLLLFGAVALCGSRVCAQSYTACYLSFDENPSGKNSNGCPSRIFLTLDSAVLNFVIGPDFDPNDPNLVDPNLCADGIVNAPVTDDQVRDLAAQVLIDQTDFYVRCVGDTGILIRKDKSSANIASCGIGTNDTRLRIRSLQVSLPALFLDLDNMADLGNDDVASGTSSVTVTINGVATAVAVDPNDPDDKLALDVVNQLELDGYAVAYGGGSGLAVTLVPGGDAVLTGGFTGGGSLTSLGIVPPICTGISSTSGNCGDPVFLTGAGIGPGSRILFGDVEAAIISVMSMATEQRIEAIPLNTENGVVTETVTFDTLGFDDCCEDSYTITCVSRTDRTNIRVTVNGVAESEDTVEIHVATAQHACPPVLSDCTIDAICSSGPVSCEGKTAEEIVDELMDGLNIGGSYFPRVPIAFSPGFRPLVHAS